MATGNRLRIAALLIAASTTVCSVGCQSTVGGQTLPSPSYLIDDVQFFPAGPEYKLAKQQQRIEEYNLQQQGFDAGGDQP